MRRDGPAGGESTQVSAEWIPARGLDPALNVIEGDTGAGTIDHHRSGALLTILVEKDGVQGGAMLRPVVR